MGLGAYLLETFSKTGVLATIYNMGNSIWLTMQTQHESRILNSIARYNRRRAGGIEAKEGYVAAAVESEFLNYASGLYLSFFPLLGEWLRRVYCCCLRCRSKKTHCKY